MVRGIVNTLGIGVIGGAVAVACYTAIALAMHRWNSGWTRLVDYLVLVPRAMPGLLAGLRSCGCSCSCRSCAAASRRWSRSGSPTRSSGLPTACGSFPARCCRSARSSRRRRAPSGASDLRVKRDVTLPLIRYGMLASWLLVFLIFVREYSTGIYLLGPGTEVIGSLLVSLWGTGAVDLVAALSVINVVMVGVGLAVAVRLGVHLHD